MHRAVHVFDNGVRVYDDHLIDVQRQRYQRRNVHEAEEEDVFVDLVRQLPPDGCYVNVGCAIGYYPLLAKRLAPGLVIHAVEPLARHRGCFLENVSLNGLAASDFVLHPEAIAASDGMAEFVEQDYGSTLVRPTPPPPSLKAAVRRILARIGLDRAAPGVSGERATTTLTLDALLRRIGRPADLVQMDVQGFETDVLRGAPRALRTGAVRTFLIGTHGLDVHEECRRMLAKNGYAIGMSVPEAADQPDGILVASKARAAVKA